ncbi:Pycsar system effector family protein [Demequina sp.]|uniref:Pycsar system effector family protein n=1 Tax=Demequina sp. TaxID=2050685 RepID=UPI0025BA373C|nr:Pycsar system effector family protein [Demequina sp.]
MSLLDQVDGVVAYWLLGAGSLFVALGLVVAASVVAPRLRSKHLDDETDRNFIFFGHARRWEPEALAHEIRRGDLTDQVARQIVVMADIAWTKHRRVGLSIWLAPVGGVLLAAAVLASKL